MRIAYVTPRYGVEVLGGAELGARMLAERLAARGHEVEVLTTCALDHRTWENELREGTDEIGGVRVTRHRTATPRARDFDEWGAPLLAAPRDVDPERARTWIRRQGPHSPALLDGIADCDADVVVFYPYLYEPTVIGILRTSRPAVLHPAAHDEPALRLPVFADVFGAASGLVFQTYAEQRLVHRCYPVADTHQIVMGLGVEPVVGDADAVRRDLGLGDTPYVLCLGRVDDGKGTGVLAEFFACWREMRPDVAARLVFAGPVHDAPRQHPDIVLAGPVDERTKWGLLTGAQLVASPSGFEAFSLVCIEAWTVGTPVLVNARCAATSEHCRRSGGGLTYGGFASFVAAMDRLNGDPQLRAQLGASGRSYAQRSFTWPTIMERYERFLGEVRERA